MNHNMTFCQSCAMPLTKPEEFGTEKDGGRNADYCHYCYENGAFTKDGTMEQMIESCIPFVSNNNPYPDAQTARSEMQRIFPQLKRWKAQAK